MTAITFDTHKFVRRLQSAGFQAEQAEAVADAFRDAQEEGQLATHGDIEGLTVELKREIERLETRMENGFESLEHRMTIKLGGLMVVAVSAVATLTKLI